MYKNALFTFFLLTFGWLNANDTQAQFYERQYAVVIGINEYQSRQWSELSYARNDAKGVAKLMEQLGFEVHLLFDEQATRENIVSLLEDDLAPRLKKEDALLFFFAGHGATRRLGEKDYGYIVPSDATDKYASLISMDELRSLSDKMGNAKHQAFIIDCCYGGLITTRNVKILESYPNFLQVVSKRQARQILTAGGKDQVVADGGTGGHSVFTGYLIKGIGEGLADSNGDNWITFNELVTYLLPAASSAIQTPGYATLPGHEQGEFLFPTLKISTSDSIVVPDSTGILQQRSSLGPVDITGYWKANETGQHPENYFNFKVVGDRLFGTRKWWVSMGMPQGKVGILDGMVDADRISFTTKHEYIKEFGRYNSKTGEQTPDVKVEVISHYEGEITGDEIHFFMNTENGYFAEFTARKIIDLTEEPSLDSKSERTSLKYAVVYTLPGHKGGVRSLSFGPDKGRLPTGGLRLASGGAKDGEVKFWDTATAEFWSSENVVPNEEEGYVNILYRAHKREGSVDLRAVGVSKDFHNVKFYNWAFYENSTAEGGGTKDIQEEVGQAAISPNLMLTATAETEGTKNSTVKLRDSNGEIKRTLDCKGVVQALAFSTDDSLLASAEKVGPGDTMIKLWNTETGELKKQINVKRLVGALAFSPGDSLLACGNDEDGNITIWKVASGRLKQTLSGDRETSVSSLTFSDTGNLLASGGISSDSIKLWDISTGKLFQTLNNDGPVGALAFSRDGRLLATGDAKKGTIKIWAKPKE